MNDYIISNFDQNLSKIIYYKLYNKSLDNNCLFYSFSISDHSLTSYGTLNLSHFNSQKIIIHHKKFSGYFRIYLISKNILRYLSGMCAVVFQY